MLYACVNRDTSRTYRLSKELISLLNKNNDFTISEVVLEEENIQPLTSETLNQRIELQGKEDFSSEVFRYARQLRDADCIVITAPHWDCGFPAILKIYLEAVTITGIVFKYGEDGMVAGLCKAEKMYYVTTRGGYIGDEKDLGYATVVALGNYYGVQTIKCISADGLNVLPNDPEVILHAAIADLPSKI